MCIIPSLTTYIPFTNLLLLLLPPSPPPPSIASLSDFALRGRYTYGENRFPMLWEEEEEEKEEEEEEEEEIGEGDIGG